MKCKFELRPLAAVIAGGACIALAPRRRASRTPSSTPPDTTLPGSRSEAAPGSDYNPPVATVGGRADADRDIPQSVTVINSALIRGGARASPTRCATSRGSRSVPRRAAPSVTTSTCAGSARAPISTSTACATAASTTAMSSHSMRSRSCRGPRRCCSAAGRPAASSTR